MGANLNENLLMLMGKEKEVVSKVN